MKFSVFCRIFEKNGLEKCQRHRCIFLFALTTGGNVLFVAILNPINAIQISPDRIHR